MDTVFIKDEVHLHSLVSEWIHSNWQKKRRLNKEEMETNVTSQ
jgi:hypothetical protein